MKLLIVGCGDLGGRAAQLAMGRGDLVYGLRRDVMRLPAGVRPLTGDVGAPRSLEFPQGVDAMIYAVAASERTDAGYARAYPAGLTNALQALDRTSPGARVIFVSSTAVYGENEGQWVDEGTALHPRGFRGERMAEAEGVLLARGRGTSLRLSGIYGPGRTRLIDTVRAGSFDPSPSARTWTNRMHVDDAARALLHVLGLDPVLDLPAQLNGTDEEPVLREDVLAFLAERLGVPGPAVRGSDTLEESRPFSNKRVRGDRLRTTGFEHLYPTYREGYSAMLAAQG